jgi:HK97 family phage major capsid protein
VGRLIIHRPGTKVTHSARNVGTGTQQFNQSVLDELGTDFVAQLQERAYDIAVKTLAPLRIKALNGWLNSFDNSSNGSAEKLAVKHYGMDVASTRKVIEAIKSVKQGKQGWVEGYLVTWGGTRDADLQGEFFTKNTDLCIDWFPYRPVLYHHGMDYSGPDRGPALKSIGDFQNKDLGTDDLGLWIQAQLNLNDNYGDAVYDMVKASDFGWSSGSVDHLVKVSDHGEIKTWPLIEGSITPTPAQPAKTTVRALKSLSIPTLRGLDARVGREEAALNESDYGGLKVATKQQLRHARAISQALGLALDKAGIIQLANASQKILKTDSGEEDDDTTKMEEYDDDAVMMGEYDDDDDAVMMGEYDDDDDAVMMEEYDDDAVMMEEYDDDAVMMGEYDDDDDAVMMDEYEDDAVMMEEYDDDAVMMDEYEDETAMSYRSRNPRPRRKVRKRARKSNKVELALRRKIKALELSEAPNERNFSPMKITDQADRPGAYTNAFKAYLMGGESRLYDHQKYTLTKGRDTYGGATTEFDINNRSIKSLGRKAYTTGSDASWGYAVPEDWVNELNKNVMTDAEMASHCRTRTTSSDRLIQPNLVTTDARRAHAGNVSWPGEAPGSQADHEATEDVLSQIAVPVHVMLISNITSLTALEDSAFSLQDEITEGFSEAVAVAYETLIYGGDGQGKLQGIVVDTDVITNRSTSNQTVSGYVPTGSTSGFLNGDVFLTALGHLPGKYRQKAAWVMNSNTNIAIRQLKDGEGNYSFPVVLADLSRAYTIARRVEFSVRRFDDSNYAELDQVLFLGRARIGGQVTQPAAIKTIKISVS